LLFAPRRSTYLHFLSAGPPENHSLSKRPFPTSPLDPRVFGCNSHLSCGNIFTLQSPSLFFQIRFLGFVIPGLLGPGRRIFLICPHFTHGGTTPPPSTPTSPFFRWVRYFFSFNRVYFPLCFYSQCPFPLLPRHCPQFKQIIFPPVPTLPPPVVPTRLLMHIAVKEGGGCRFSRGWLDLFPLASAWVFFVLSPCDCGRVQTTSSALLQVFFGSRPNPVDFPYSPPSNEIDFPVSLTNGPFP